MDDYLLPNIVMSPLVACLHNGVHFFFISRVLTDNLQLCLTMIGHRVVVVSENDTQNIV
jgi:hypothetical protein